MKAKNANAVIRAKFNRFLEHIRNDDIRRLVAENTIVTGGAIASLLLGEEIHDFDMYFRTGKVAQKVAEHYCEEFAKNPPPRFKHGYPIQIAVIPLHDRVKIIVKSAGVASENDPAEYKYFEQTDQESGDTCEYISKVLDVIHDGEDKEKPKYRPVFLSTNAITLSDKVQLVTRFFGEPDEIHKNYDFAHVTNYWTSWENKLVLRPEALEALLAKELRYVGSKYPLCSIIRTRKFIRRGWSVNAGQYLKMVMQLQELDLNDIGVLEEQLTGVDVAYFFEVISALRARDDKRVDNAYLVELIDRIF